MNKKARLGPNNGRYKGIPKNSEPFFITGFLSGLSTRTLSYRWFLMHKEKIDYRRIKRWLDLNNIKK